MKEVNEVMFRENGFFYLLDRIKTNELKIDKNRLLILIIGLEFSRLRNLRPYHHELNPDVILNIYHREELVEDVFVSLNFCELRRKIEQNLNRNPWQFIKTYYFLIENFSYKDLLDCSNETFYEIYNPLFHGDIFKKLLDYFNCDPHFLYDCDPDDIVSFDIHFGVFEFLFTDDWNGLVKFLFNNHIESDRMRIHFTKSNRTNGERSKDSLVYFKKNQIEYFNFPFESLKYVIEKIAKRGEYLRVTHNLILTEEQKEELTKITDGDIFYPQEIPYNVWLPICVNFKKNNMESLRI